MLQERNLSGTRMQIAEFLVLLGFLIVFPEICYVCYWRYRSHMWERFVRIETARAQARRLAKALA